MTTNRDNEIGNYHIALFMWNSEHDHGSRRIDKERGSCCCSSSCRKDIKGTKYIICSLEEASYKQKFSDVTLPSTSDRRSSVRAEKGFRSGFHFPFSWAD